MKKHRNSQFESTTTPQVKKKSSRPLKPNRSNSALEVLMKQRRLASNTIQTIVDRRTYDDWDYYDYYDYPRDSNVKKQMEFKEVTLTTVSTFRNFPSLPHSLPLPKNFKKNPRLTHKRPLTKSTISMWYYGDMELHNLVFCSETPAASS